MNEPISKNVHGLIDYSYGLVVPLLPECIGFTEERSAKLLCRSLGLGALGYSLITKARWGVIHILPFKAHLAIDISVSCLAMATPWLLGFSHNKAARNTLLSVGLSGLLAATLTDPRERLDGV